LLLFRRAKALRSHLKRQRQQQGKQQSQTMMSSYLQFGNYMCI
jgi:hypothetical protein